MCRAAWLLGLSLPTISLGKRRWRVWPQDLGISANVDGDWVVAYCLSSMLAPKSKHADTIWPHTVHSAVTGSRRVRGVGQRSTKPIAVTNHGFVGCPTGGGAELTKATTLGSCVKRSKHGQRRGQHMEPVLFPNVSTTNMCCCWIATPVIVVCIAYGASLMLWCARIVWVASVCGASLINMGCLRVRVWCMQLMQFA